MIEFDLKEELARWTLQEERLHRSKHTVCRGEYVLVRCSNKRLARVCIAIITGAFKAIDLMAKECP